MPSQDGYQYPHRYLPTPTPLFFFFFFLSDRMRGFCQPPMAYLDIFTSYLGRNVDTLPF
jgi:hypothetical protein